MADILVVGLSARALCQSARLAGFRPLAADFFGDLDLQESAEAHVRVEGDFETGLDREPLIAALETLAARRDPVGIVCGTGFEDRPHLLDALEVRWPLCGNGADAVRRVKDPEALAKLCRRIGIPHPRWSEAAQEGWLSKHRGGAGGAHIWGARSLSPFSREGTEKDFQPIPLSSSDERSSIRGPRAAQSRSALGTRVKPECDKPVRESQSAERPTTSSEPDRYWQERVSGEPVSALVLGSGEDALVLGFSEQWPDPAPDAAYRYGGAVRPAGLSGAATVELEAAARNVVMTAGLVGLNSVDFLVAPEGWHLIEINPRPGATLDIFEPTYDSLVGLHVRACQGRLPDEQPDFAGAAAAAILYARRGVECVQAIDWPDWTADRQSPGTSIPEGAPVCTIRARAETPDAARRLVAERAASMQTVLGTG